MAGLNVQIVPFHNSPDIVVALLRDDVKCWWNIRPRCRARSHRKPRASVIQAISSANTWMREGDGDTSWLYGYDAWNAPLHQPAPHAAPRKVAPARRKQPLDRNKADELRAPRFRVAVQKWAAPRRYPEEDANLNKILVKNSNARDAGERIKWLLVTSP
jgi:hypothetical protein